MPVGGIPCVDIVSSNGQIENQKKIQIETATEGANEEGYCTEESDHGRHRGGYRGRGRLPDLFRDARRSSAGCPG